MCGETKHKHKWSADNPYMCLDLKYNRILLPLLFPTIMRTSSTASHVSFCCAPGSMLSDKGRGAMPIIMECSELGISGALCNSCSLYGIMVRIMQPAFAQ